jgi:photosystem II stability/assembly factor-like uncharacterized protein
VKRIILCVMTLIFLPTNIPYSSSRNGVNNILFPKETVITANPAEGWKSVGPGGGGAIFVPVISPHDPKTAMVACDMTGTYITHDAGETWKQLNLRSTVNAIAFDPVNPKTIYASSTGLFRSDDGGENWQLVYPNPKNGVTESMIGDHGDHWFASGDNWPGGALQFIRVDPSQPNNLYLGIKSGDMHIFYSTNRGQSWKKGVSFSKNEIKHIYIDPSSPKDNRAMYVFTDMSIYKVSTGTFKYEKIETSIKITNIKFVSCGLDPSTKKPVFYLTTKTVWDGKKLYTGVMRSMDQGKTWKEMTAGLDADLRGVPAGNSREFTAIATAEYDASKVYLAIERYPELSNVNKAKMNYLGMFKSENYGTSWKWSMRVGDKDPGNKKGGWLERNYDTDWVGAPKRLAVCPSNPDVCYYTGIGMAFNSYDGGETWKQAYSNDNPDGSATSRGIEVTTTYGVHFDPHDKNHLIISYTDIGMFQSNNGGKSWSQAIKGVPREWINTCYWMVFDPEVKGRAWSVWSYAHDLPREKMFRRDISTYTGGVCKTDDGIATWKKSNTGMPENTVATHIVLDPGSPAGKRTLYVAAAGKGVFKSTDDGKTWKLKNTGISGSLNAWRLVLTPDGTLYLLVIRGLKEGSQVDGDMYKSVDGAEHWEKSAMPSGVNAPNDLVYDNTNPKRLYLACWPKTVNGSEQNGGLYVSEDAGKSWRNIFDETSHVYSVAVDPFDNSVLFIVTFEGAAYRSDDMGATWNKLKGYDFKWGHRPIPDPYDIDRLYITTFGSSVWYGSKR